MSPITLDSLQTNETISSRSRTFSPEVVKRVHEFIIGEGEGITEPAKNIAVGTFEKEGAARSALTTLNKLLKENHGHEHAFSGTVRQTEDGKYRALLINKPAKKVERKKKVATPAPAPARTARS